MSFYKKATMALVFCFIIAEASSVVFAQNYDPPKNDNSGNVKINADSNKGGNVFGTGTTTGWTDSDDVNNLLKKIINQKPLLYACCAMLEQYDKGLVSLDNVNVACREDWNDDSHDKYEITERLFTCKVKDAIRSHEQQLNDELNNIPSL